MTASLSVEVRVDDLAFFQGDAIARPATSLLAAITPVVRRLELAAGPKLIEQLRIQDPLPVGSAVVTGAGDLAVELLIHGVIQSDSERVTNDGVRRALRSALQRTVDWQLDTVGLAPFGLGAGNLDPEDSAAMLAEAVQQHLQGGATYPKTLIIVSETVDEADIFRHSLRYRGI